MHSVFCIQGETLAHDLRIAVTATPVEIDHRTQVAFEETAAKRPTLLDPHRRAQRLVFDQLLAAMHKEHLSDLEFIGLAIRHLAQSTLRQGGFDNKQRQNGHQPAHQNSFFKPMPSP